MKPQKTTGIGSLPHHNIDAALAFSFQMGIPFLPQIPIRNPWEYMVPQALVGLPGLQIEKDGTATLDVDVWQSRTRYLEQHLIQVLGSSPQGGDFTFFEPSTLYSSSWTPFLWELEEHGSSVAKIQLAGPLTSQWALRLKNGKSIESYPEISTQIYHLVLARAMAMTRRLQAMNIQPILYLDEPALYCFSPNDPRHLFHFQELKLLINTLRKEKVWIGLHCCSNTDWSTILSLELNFLSIDTHLSLAGVLGHTESLEKFIQRGGRFSLGVIPTHRPMIDQNLSSAQDIFINLMNCFSHYLKNKPDLSRQIIQEAIFTPACGLALHSIGGAETILATLLEFQRICTR